MCRFVAVVDVVLGFVLPRPACADKGIILDANSDAMMRDLLDGLFAYLRAVKIISRLRLWGYVLVPGLLSALLAIAVISAAWGWSDELGGFVMRAWPFEWGTGVVSAVSRVFGSLLIVLAGLVLFKHLILILSGPFMSPLSEKVEAWLAGYDEPLRFDAVDMVKQLVRGLVLGVRNALLEIFLTIPLLLLGLIPVLTPLATTLIFVIQAYYAGFGNMDFALERHFMVRDSIRFVRRHRWLAVGNGVVYLLLLFTGLGFLVALPLGVVAATVETVKRLKA